MFPNTSLTEYLVVHPTPKTSCVFLHVRVCSSHQIPFMGMLKKGTSGVLAIFRAHVLEVLSALQNRCGLGGRIF